MNMSLFRHVYGLAVFLCVPAFASGQTITTGPVNSEYCVGDTINVPFTVTGTFQPGNVFILQLSGPGGEFDTQFINITSISETTSGTIAAKINSRFQGETTYKVRVIGSYPAVTGNTSENSFVVHSRLPEPIITSPDSYLWSTVATIELTASGVGEGIQVHWDFGENAVPATSDQLVPPPVHYSSFGTKEVRFTVGTAQQCPVTVSTFIQVSPTVFSIPADAIPITTKMPRDSSFPNATLWICPGASYFANKGELLFIEAGGHADVDVAGGGTRTVYMKPGSSLGGWACPTFYAEGAGISYPYPPPQCMHQMPEISFDYTLAPAGGCPSLAPYSIDVSSGAETVSSMLSRDDDGKEFVLQPQGVLYTTGQNNRFLIANGGRVEAAGDHCTVYVQSGGTFEAKGSKHHRIFYEEGATIVDPGQEATLFPASTISFVMQTPVDVRPAEPVATGLMIGPNPVANTLTLYRTQAGQTASLVLLDMLGTVMTKGTMAQGETAAKLDLPSLPKGMYFLRVQQGRTVEHIKVFVQ